MSQDTFGTCVVLVPTANNYPNTVPGGQHITLAYFGDEPLSDERLIELTTLVADLSDSIQGPIELIPKALEQFGDANVLTFWDSENSQIANIRQEMFSKMTPELMAIFEEAEKYPDFKPHMTLGYGSDGYIPQFVVEELVTIQSISVWDGDDHTDFQIEGEYADELIHIGILRKSGRYPWGSGENAHQRNRQFLDYVDDLKKKGLSETQIAEGMGMFDPDAKVSTTELRAAKTIAKNQQKQAQISQAEKLKRKGVSNSAIGREMGINESSVRALLAPGARENADRLTTTANMLRDQLDKKQYLDVGKGVENQLGISSNQLAVAVSMLREEGYSFHYVKEKQLGTGKETLFKVLAKPDVTYSEVRNNRDKIEPAGFFSEDSGKTYLALQPPLSMDSKRVGVRYAEQGGTDRDGVIQVRRGVADANLGNSKYAQVRIAVDGTHYLKGMAVYADDLPDGVDLMFNTNKSDTGNKLDAMKPMKTDKDGKVDQANPFGSAIKPNGQQIVRDANGKERVTSVMNIVNEEGDWSKWSNNISSQALSKQTPALAKKQLDLKFQTKQAEYEEIMSLTNPTVRKELLRSFSDDMDSSAVHLKAAALPRQKTQVILPISSLRDTEIYAPQFKDGESVVLIRYPHGGIFEIPELTVNNKNREAGKILKQATDAVGINSKVAERLSGADFDGDTVLVIPNNTGAVKTAAALKGLKGFDPKVQYRAYEGMPKLSPGRKQTLMGDVSNLITDMTVQGAPHEELVRAVRHSMVVIDAEKHNLNYKQSHQDNGIADLKRKYQGSTKAGAATLISRASSQKQVDNRKARSAKEGGAIDPTTGKKMWVPTGENYIIPAHTKVNAKGQTIQVPDKIIYRKTKSTKMAEADDARDLISDANTVIENVYATHANRLKALGNQARKAYVETPNLVANPAARKTYAPQYATLRNKLNIALMNAPQERRAQLLANAKVSAKRAANPDMEPDEVKKVKTLALTEARLRTGAKKKRIEITPIEWEAIQAGAITDNFLRQILANTDLDKIKELATPRERTTMSSANLSRAKQMLANGYNQGEIAELLGVPTSTLNDALTGA
jgi:2'-5' RNA ligase/biotin operon repressor